jgi:hypothetical protein
VEDISSLAVDALTVEQNQSVLRLMESASALAGIATARDAERRQLELGVSRLRVGKAPTEEGTRFTREATALLPAF